MPVEIRSTLIPVLIVSTLTGLYFTLSYFLRDDYSWAAYIPGYTLALSYLIVKCCSVSLGFNSVRSRLLVAFILYTILICMYYYPLWWSFFSKFRDNDFMHVLIIITFTELLHTYRSYFFPKNQ